jgi:choice-of-anchor B domain-containing protein
LRSALLAAALLAPVLTSLLAPAPRAQNLVACQGGTASGYACDGVDLYARFSPQALGAPADCPPYLGACGNDIWGWTHTASGREFALVGVYNGTAFVEITDPDAPVYLGRLPTATGSSPWRDLETYGDHAFIVSEAGGHGMQVFDLTRLLDVASPPQTFTADARFTGFGSAHTVALDPESGYAYAAGSTACGGGLYIVDVRAPAAPVQAGCFSADGYTHDAQCVVYDGPDADYTGREICMASNEDTVTIVDVTDKAAPVLVSRAFYPGARYTHQGWFTEDKRYFLVNDEGHQPSNGTWTIVLEVADLDSPSFAFQHFGAVSTRAHNLYVRGQYAFESNYEGGLRILDLSGIDSGVLTEVAYFDTYPQGQSPSGWEGQWANYPFFPSGTVIANDQWNGLFILKPNLTPTASEPPAPEGPGGAAFVLSAPTPNPSREGIALILTVARAQAVRAEVLDVAGRRVALLHDGPVAAGTPLPLRLDGTGFPAGLYLVRVAGEDFATSQRVSLIR